MAIPDGTGSLCVPCEDKPRADGALLFARRSASVPLSRICAVIRAFAPILQRMGRRLGDRSDLGHQSIVHTIQAGRLAACLATVDPRQV